MGGMDIFILVVIAAGMIRGFSTGMIKQVASLIGLVISFVFAIQLMDTIGDLAIQGLGLSPDAGPLLGFVMVFVAVQLAIFTLARFSESLIEALHLSVFNRALGGVVGGLKAVLALSVLFLAMSYFELPNEDVRKSSEFYSPVASSLTTSWDYVAQQFPKIKSLTGRFADKVESTVTNAGN